MTCPEKDAADHPGVNTQHRVDVDACSSSQLDQQLAVDPCLQCPGELRARRRRIPVRLLDRFSHLREVPCPRQQRLR